MLNYLHLVGPRAARRSGSQRCALPTLTGSCRRDVSGRGRRLALHRVGAAGPCAVRNWKLVQI